MSEDFNFEKEKPGQLIKITGDEIIRVKYEINACGIPLWRYNKEKKQVVVPVGKIDQYLGDENLKVEFFIQKDWKEVVDSYIEHEEEKKEPRKNFFRDTETSCLEQIKAVHKLGFAEREEILDDSIGELNELMKTKRALDLESITNMVKVIINTLYVNNVTLEQNEARAVPEVNIYGVISKTKWIIDCLIAIIFNGAVNYKDFGALDKISTGSVTIDQINKVFLRFVAFCNYYNSFIDEGMINRKIRKIFKLKLARFYKRRLKLERITLETVFDGGMRRITEKEISEFALGALLHDIGKLPDIDYHDSNEEYNDKRVKMHVLIGYNMIINADGFPFEVAAMTVFHHEYYGDNSGYNFTRPIMARHKHQLRSEHNMKYFISYSAGTYLNKFALSFFSAKVLEIFDVFSGLYDKKKHSAIESLKIIKQKFISDKLKLDPVIFEIFIDFLIKCGLVNNSEIRELDEIL